MARHGSTDANTAKPRIVRGHLDFPLNDVGREEMARLADKLVSSYSVGLIISSQFLRDIQSAQIIATRTQAPIRIDTQAAPWDQGELSGQAEPKVWPIMLYLYRNPNMPAPGGESFGAYVVRFKTTFRNAYVLSKQMAPRDVLLIGHGNDFLALDAGQLNITKPKYIDTGEMKVFR